MWTFASGLRPRCVIHLRACIAFAFSWATLAKLTFVHLTLAHNQCQWIKLSVALRPDGSLDGCPTVRVEPDARQPGIIGRRTKFNVITS